MLLTLFNLFPVKLSLLLCLFVNHDKQLILDVLVMNIFNSLDYQAWWLVIAKIFSGNSDSSLWTFFRISIEGAKIWLSSTELC